MDKKFEFLDRSLVGFLAVVQDGFPIVLPMAFVRFGDEIHVHGSTANNNLRHGLGLPVCFTTTIIDGLVLAKLASNHSFNYRSTVVFGELEEIRDEAAKARSMEGLIERYYPGRYQSLRKLNSKELRTIKVARLSLENMSAKQRSGPPVSDESEPYPNAWVGTLGVENFLGAATQDPQSQGPNPEISGLFFSSERT